MGKITDRIVIIHITEDSDYPSPVKRSVACHTMSGEHSSLQLRCGVCGVYCCYTCADHREVKEAFMSSVLCPVCGAALVSKRDEYLIKT